jgi:outer membrane lipoprotein LolB
MTRRRLFPRLAPALLAALLLAGCVTTGEHADPQTGPWSGRLSVRVDSQPPQSFSAAFELAGDAGRGQLRLFSPFGSTLAELRWQPGGAALLQGGGERHFESVDALLEQATGAPLSAQALFDWLRGQPADLAGWQADLSQWPEGRLSARRQTPPAAELRLVLDR